MNTFTRKTLIFIVVMAVVAFGGWFGRKIYKKATEHRLVAEAGSYLQKQDFRNASLCLQRALQINPFNVSANKLTADMLEEAGSPEALNWRIRTAQLQTNNVEYRFAWGLTALKMNDLPSAVQALRGVDVKYRSTAEFHKLAGGLAWNLHDTKDAEIEYAEALRLEPTNQAIAINLSTVRLVSTNKAVANQARSSLEQIPVNSPLHLLALRDLATDALVHNSFKRAVYYSQALANDPRATYADKLAHLQVLHMANSPGFDSWEAALERDAVHSPYHAYALAHWMQLAESPGSALRWLQGLPADVQTNMPVPLAITDCQIEMKDWPGLLSIVERQDWGELNYYRLSLGSLGNRSLDDNIKAENAWQGALSLSSHRLDRLARLNQLTGTWGWNQERKDLLEEIMSEFPHESWAAEQLVALLYASGETQAMADLLDRMYAADPSNVHLENNLATVLLLLKSDLEKAHRLALESYNSSTNNPFYACTYAYSLLLQSRPQEAVRVIGSVKTDYLKNPSIAAYYGIVEANAGNENLAKGPLKLAESGRLLPEELKLVREAESRLQSRLTWNTAVAQITH